MKIPYANCDFADIRRQGFLYADKTPCIPALEDAGGNYLIFLRPRRFGKSTLISTLANYYDIESAGELIVRGTGFVRSFYATLKAFTSTSTLARMFITGVSPIMLDDLSSGFNIITPISQRDTFNMLTGFTQAEVEQAVDTLLRDKPELKNDPRIGDRAALL